MKLMKLMKPILLILSIALTFLLPVTALATGPSIYTFTGYQFNLTIPNNLSPGNYNYNRQSSLGESPITRPYAIHCWYQAYSDMYTSYIWWSRLPNVFIQRSIPEVLCTFSTQSQVGSFSIPANSTAFISVDFGQAQPGIALIVPPNPPFHLSITYQLDEAPPNAPDRPNVQNMGSGGNYSPDGVIVYTRNQQVSLTWTTPADNVTTYNGYSSGGYVKDFMIFNNGVAVTDWITGNQYSFSLNQGRNEIQLKARDYDNNVSALGTNRVIILDTTPPNAFTITANPSSWSNNRQPALTFGTTDNGSGIDHYELAIDNGSFTTVASPCTLPVLSDGVHSINVKAINNSGLSTSATTNVYIDYNYPNLTINKPTNSSIIWNTVTLETNATDIVGIQKVEYYMDGILNKTLTSPTSSTLYAYPLDTTAFADGLHTITAKAYDKANNIMTQSINITIINQTPSTNILSPVQNENLKGTITVKAGVNSSVSLLEFYLDNIKKASLTGAPLEYTFDTSAYSNGLHTILLKAYNPKGDMAQSSINVFVRNPIDIQQVQPLAPIN